MNTKDLIRLGVPTGEPMKLAHEFIQNFIAQGRDGAQLETEIANLVADPSAFFADPLHAPLARALFRPAFTPRAELAPWKQWGADLEPEAIKQMANALRAAVAVAGALMPDAHLGYGLPIGGVLATDNAVVPYAVGVDIACRMKLTVYDRKANTIAGQRDRLANILESETRFGVGATFKERRDHEVMDDDWAITPLTKRLRDKAWAQLGTSGSGNHFVEFGAFTVTTDDLGIPPGEYVALLSHSGSRGAGAQVCAEYFEACDGSPRAPAEGAQAPGVALARRGRRPGILGGDEPHGRYAAANHALIHKHVAKKLGASVILDIENHHNFAWKERHVLDGVEREVIVHRKGANARGRRRARIIPGSMASPGFVVRGQGPARVPALGLARRGRVMSRTKAMQSFTWSAVKKAPRRARRSSCSRPASTRLPGVYKDIHAVMAAQTDLVDVLGEFQPRLVKMCPAASAPRTNRGGGGEIPPPPIFKSNERHLETSRRCWC